MANKEHPFGDMIIYVILGILFLPLFVLFAAINTKD